MIAGLANFVVALEADGALAEQAKVSLTALAIDNVKVVTGPLGAGSPSNAPYDVIFVEGAVEVLPASLFAQMKEGGRLVTVIGYGRAALATLYNQKREADRPARGVQRRRATAAPVSGNPKPLCSDRGAAAVASRRKFNGGFMPRESPWVEYGDFDMASEMFV